MTAMVGKPRNQINMPRPDAYAGTFQRDGASFYNDFTFSVPLAQPVSATGRWYSSVEVLQMNSVGPNGVPEPGSLFLLTAGLLAMATSGRRRLLDR